MTAALANPTHGELPPTRTYPRRGYRWEPAYPGQSVRDGTLEIWLVKGKRKLRIEHRTYAVQIVWQECDAEAGVWSFMLENQDDPDEEGPFACVVGGAVELCGCEAGGFDRVRIRRQTSCKHRDSLSALIQTGEIE